MSDVVARKNLADTIQWKLEAAVIGFADQRIDREKMLLTVLHWECGDRDLALAKVASLVH